VAHLAATSLPPLCVGFPHALKSSSHALWQTRNSPPPTNSSCLPEHGKALNALTTASHLLQSSFPFSSSGGPDVNASGSNVAPAAGHVMRYDS
jgi:hypothetical protein